MGKPGYLWFSSRSSRPADGHDRCRAMFQGETAITIDDKGRLAIPTAYRDAGRARMRQPPGHHLQPLRVRLPLPVPASRSGSACATRSMRCRSTKQRQPQPAAEAGRRGDASSSPTATAASAAGQPSQRGRASRRRPCCWAWATSSSCGASRRTTRRSGQTIADDDLSEDCSTCSCDGRWRGCAATQSGHLPGDVCAGHGRPAGDGGWNVPGWHLRARRTCARRAANSSAREAGCW